MIPRSALALSFLALSSLGTSCMARFFRIPKEQPVNFYKGDHRDLMTVRRIMILPFGGSDMPEENLHHLNRSFLTELTELHRFQVVPLPDFADDERKILESEEKGRITAKGLVEIGKRYNLDGILIGQVTSFQAYLPPILGLRIHLLSVHSGETVWAIDEVFNASKEAMRLDLLDYEAKTLVEEASLHESEMILLSPRRFAEYVVARVVSTLKSP